MNVDPFISMWVVYDHPSDFPNHFVARRHDIYRGEEPQASREYVIAATLEGIRHRIPPGLACLPRYADDDPNIVEIWL